MSGVVIFTALWFTGQVVLSFLIVCRPQKDGDIGVSFRAAFMLFEALIAFWAWTVLP